MAAPSNAGHNVTTNGVDEEKGLHRTATAVTMSPELFEKLYLTPKVPVAGDYNKRFANPTALGFVGCVFDSGLVWPCRARHLG